MLVNMEYLHVQTDIKTEKCQQQQKKAAAGQEGKQENSEN